MTAGGIGRHAVGHVVGEEEGAGAARVYNVEVYLCPKCGCKGRYDEKALKIIEIN